VDREDLIGACQQPSNLLSSPFSSAEAAGVHALVWSRSCRRRIGGTGRCPRSRPAYLDGMVEIVIGTTNAAKARQCEIALAGTAVRTCRITELVEAVPDVVEDAEAPEENAAKKAATYARLVGRPVLSLDYGLHFDGVADKDQPGVNVRRIPGFGGRPTDEELVVYYANLLRRYGGSVRGRWRSGIAAATPRGRLARAGGEVARMFVAAACPARTPGHPLASLQLVGDRYVAELGEEEEAALLRETLRRPLIAVIEGVLRRDGG
jgi:hypothetical protein